MSKIQLPSGTKIKKFEWVSEQDILDVVEVLKTGELSGFLATSGEEHLGGNKVKELELAWSKFTGVKSAVSFNSWTSGLEAAVAVLDLPYGAEIIVTPWTMSATIAAIVNNNLTPVFADISRDSFNISPREVRKLLSEKTRAIMAVDIFGKSCDFVELREIADKHNIELIIDSAQAPTATRDGKKSAHFASICGYSFNRHKHIQCGEGGIAITNNEAYATRMRLYRNHSEVSSTDLENKIRGHNLRFGELEATIILGQLKRINQLVDHRVDAAKKIISGLRNIEGIRVPILDSNESHDFYIVGLELTDELSERRDEFVDQLVKAGLPGILKGYVNAHNLPQFLKYKTVSLPIAEELHEKTFVGIYMCGVEWTESLITFLVEKVEDTSKELRAKKASIPK